MKLFSKLEELINKGIEFLIHLIKIFFSKLIPISLKNKIKQIFSKPISTYKKVKKRTSLRIKKIKGKLIVSPSSIIGLLKEHLHINTIKKIKDSLSKDKIFELINILKIKYQKSNKKYIYGTLVIMMIMIGTTAYFIKIEALKNELSSIEIAQKNIHHIPSYIKTMDKQILTEAIKLPVIVNSKTYSSIELSFIALASNHFILIFLKKYEYRIKDHLYTTISPTLSKFLFTEEGKKIIAEKIKNEINILLKQYKIRGHIKSVYLTEIILG